MIDFVKIIVEDFNGNVLKDDSPLTGLFHKVYNEDTGELMKSSIAIFNDLKFVVFDNGTTVLKGSLHKFSNNGLHNHDDFTYSRLVKTLNMLSKNFGLSLDKCKLQNLEVGLNIDPLIDTGKLLDNIIMHKRKEFKDVYVKGGDYRQAEHTAYYLKAYDKALQHQLSENIFRWEIKMMRNELIKKQGIQNISDLLIKNNLKRLLKDLISKWKETLVLDSTIQINDLTGIEFTKLQSWRYTDYWIRLRKYNVKSNRFRFTKELNDYKNLVKYHSSNIQQKITETLLENMNYCMNN